MHLKLIPISLLLGAATAVAGSNLSVRGRSGSEDAVVLIGPDARQQLVVTSGPSRDVTHDVQWSVSPGGVVAFDGGGFLKPVADGQATVSVSHSDGSIGSIRVRVQQSAEPQPINFTNDVVPILTRYGCNGGGCHGKSGGQNGFRLSLLGYEPWNDFDYLTRESRGRRIFPAVPERSLLLTKATGETPHGGGARMDPESHDFQFLVRWIRQGMPYGRETDPSIQRIEVFPKQRVAAPGARQQLSVTAHYSDGTTRDITRAVQYEANQEEMAEVAEDGLVTFKELPGSTSIMVRFQEKVDVFVADLPLGAPVPAMVAANFIDDLVQRKLKLLGLPPSERTGDAAFLRRVTLDLAGRLPSKSEIESFLKDPSPDKRARRIDALLVSDDCAEWFAGKWTAILRNKRAKPEYAFGTYAFHDWIRRSLAENLPFDRMVTELLTASGDLGQSPATAWYRAVPDQKDRMQDIAQIFLGVRVQCAQCHHHPYEKWSQDDYYSFAAFFSTLGTKAADGPGETIVFHQRKAATMANPRTGKALPPAPLGSEALQIAPERDPRFALADWMSDRENPFFARMLVNRYWKHFFGRGLVEPEDDMRVTNPATHPELLDALATYFTVSGYDLRELMRLIVSSNTYQLSAEPNSYNLTDRQNYSRFYPRRLPAEVLLDSINMVAETEESFGGQEKGTRAIALPDDSYNKEVYFLSVFGRPAMESACECERTADANLAQSLHLINSPTLQGKLAHPQGRAARLAALSAPDQSKISDLYLAAVGRGPEPKELEAALGHLARKRGTAAAGEARVKADQIAFEDMLWALINTKEFLFNH
ncbi:MAG: Protein of unknown function DUF1553/DUF1549/Ig-like domain (group 2) [Verrucomicrobia bacterium]|nr:MAG: Protein of unknown function DUF1553/DUF1549/Ig-like domain (group 2) [Verrucomicrobiota bacterium]